jgi:hypothetical protein
LKEESENVYRIAVKKAALEIKKIEIQQGKILRQLVKLDVQYKVYQEVENIKSMRYTQFGMKREYFLRKLREYTQPDAELRLSRINKNREFRYIWNQRL